MSRIEHRVVKMKKNIERSYQKTQFVHQKEERLLLPIRPIWAPFIFCPSFLYLIKLQMRSNNSSQYTMEWDHYIYVMISSILPIYLFISSSSLLLQLLIICATLLYLSFSSISKPNQKAFMYFHNPVVHCGLICEYIRKVERRK